MNPQDFPAALAGLVNSALAHGLNPLVVIGTLETVKLDLVRAIQDKSREQKITPARIVPNGR